MNTSRHILLSEASSGTVRFLSGIHVTLDEGKTQSWVTVTRTGKFTDPRYGDFEISRDMLNAMVKNFNERVYGQDIFYDVSHQPGNGAAGKVLALKVEGDRLRALVEWTPYGIDAIKNKGYAYSSIEYHDNYQDNESKQTYGPVMMGAGLVVRPCIKRLDPIQLSEASVGNVPTLIHPELQSILLQEITDMKNKMLEALKKKCGELNLDAGVSNQLAEAMGNAMDNDGDEKQCQEVLAQYVTLAESISKQIGSKPAQLNITAPSLGKTLSEADITRILDERAAAQEKAAKKLAEIKASNIKLLSDTINAASGIDDADKKALAEECADLITPEMSADHVKRLAEMQIKKGNDLAVAKHLSAMGYSRPAGNVHITVDSSNQVKALQEHADRRLGITGMADARRFRTTGGQLQTVNKELAERVLAEFDAANGAKLHLEHKMLAAGDGLVSDVAVPAIFERTVIREALYSMIGLQFVDIGTLPFSASALIPYSYRDTTAAGINSTRVYEGGSIPRAGVKQTSETAYPTPQKIAFEVSDELRYLTGNGQIDWDAVAENARNATRIIGEDSERLIFNEILQASDQYSAVAVTNEATATADGTKTIFVLDHFPVVRPKKIYDLQGNQVGSTQYAVVVKSNNVAITEYDGTGTQTAGLYYTMDYNLGEVRFVNQLGVATAPTATHAIVSSYSYATNVYAFDTDLGSNAVDAHWDTFLYRYGLRKNVIESDRYHMANFGLMSGTIRTQIEQARSFIESAARNGTNLDAQGNLGMIKDVPNFRTTAPGLYMGDQRIVIGERGQTRFRMMKPWSMGQLQDQRDANGRFTGKKEAYGDQFVVLHTPTQLKSAYTSLVLYSGAERVDR